ncbi:MAG: UpxY family transcription antiterminator [Bacteroidales bacterium]|nr:UpxY family transcription antiterminator [Bacteroidales bacterium]
MEEVKLHWYALKVFWRKINPVEEKFDEMGLEYYAQSILPSYLFVRTDNQTIKKLRLEFFGKFYVYSDYVTKEPTVVPDKELEIFRIVTSAGDTGLQFLDEDAEKYRKGDKVRVIDGPFKGAEGYVVRIKKDRRLVVTISGVAAIATSYIPQELLEKVYE